MLGASYPDRSGVGFMQWFGPETRRWLGILAVVALLGDCSSSATEQKAQNLVQQAFDLHQKGQFSEALPLLYRAYELAPQDYFVNLLLGIDSLRTGQVKTAVPFLNYAAIQTCWRSVLRQNPQTPLLIPKILVPRAQL